jgi:hypothetical protein
MGLFRRTFDHARLVESLVEKRVRLADLSAEREELEWRAAELTRDATLIPFTGAGGHDREFQLAAQANGLLERARAIQIECLDLTEELRRDDELRATTQPGGRQTGYGTGQGLDSAGRRQA